MACSMFNGLTEFQIAVTRARLFQLLGLVVSLGRTTPARAIQPPVISLERRQPGRSTASRQAAAPSWTTEYSIYLLTSGILLHRSYCANTFVKSLSILSRTFLLDPCEHTSSFPLSQRWGNMDSFVSVSYPQKQQIASSSEVILVTGPHCLEEVSDGAVQVESATCESVKLSPFQPRTIKRVFTPVAAYFDAQDDDAVELQEGTQQRETNSTQELHLDPSREHGYKYAYTQDDLDDQSHILDLDVSTFSTNTFREQASEHPEYSLIHVLGKSYHPVNDYAERRTDECSLLWFTYRCDFPEIAPYRITTDAGWGCMLRSAQMMLGQALRVHFKSRSWQPPLPIAERKMDHFVRSLLTWFADYPSRHECVFSLHNMVAAGLAKYDVLPGEWYGPGTAAYVMRDLAELYEQQRVQHENTLPIFRVYVASQGVVYRDAVNDLMTRQAQELRSKLEVSTPKPEPLHPLDTLHVESCNLKSTAELTWDTALLILIPLRLGLRGFQH